MKEQPREFVPIPLPWRLSRELRLPRPPLWMIALLTLAVVLAALPLVWLLAVRGKPFSQPRVDWIQDMGVQPRVQAQSSSSLFLDHRGMRLPVPGTVARGSLQLDPRFFAGYATEESAEGSEPATVFFDDFPDEIRQRNVEAVRARGMERFSIYCLPCHGTTGGGDGPISQRAKQLNEPKWVAPAHLMTQAIRDKPNGYLFSVISRGVRNMPSYAIQIAPEDRWAIVAYLRQLQAEQPVAPDPAAASNSPNRSPLPTDNQSPAEK